MRIILWKVGGFCMTAKMLLEQYMAERHALGFVSKTDEGCIRRFLRDYKEPEDGKIVFSKEYVLEHIGTGLNQKANTVLRDVSAINGFLNFVIRNYCKKTTVLKWVLPNHKLPCRKENQLHVII